MFLKASAMENEFFKISKTKVKRDVSKNVCYGERHFFFWNEGGRECLLCKNIDVLINYKEVGIYLKYSTPHPL